MGSCKFEKNDWKCPLDAEEDSDYCYWHQIIDGKFPIESRIISLRRWMSKEKFTGLYLNLANLNYLHAGALVFREAYLIRAKLNSSNCTMSIFDDSRLNGTEFNNSVLSNASFKRANMRSAVLKDAIIDYATLNYANLSYADLQGADLHNTNMICSSLVNTFFDSKSILDNAFLTGSNLYRAYIDKTSSFRNATFFKEENIDEKEINEFIADTCYLKGRYPYQYKKEILFDAVKIKKLCMEQNIPDTFLTKLKEIDVIRGCNWGKNPWKDIGNQSVVMTLLPRQFMYRKPLTETLVNNMVIEYKNVINAYENKKLTLKEKQFFDDLVISKSLLGIDFLLPVDEDPLIDINQKELYEASYEVYNKLYNFYKFEGDSFRIKHTHYRASEVSRKLLNLNNNWNTVEGLKDRFYWLFDWLVLKMLTGYGESILRPVLISIFWIIAFGFIYMILEGVKVVGRAANWFDCFYLSMTTFTSLGFADVQPDITVKWMQPLIMAESTMGVAMVALIIFVITYKISR